jgi:hypothetical protein
LGVRFDIGDQRQILFTVQRDLMHEDFDHRVLSQVRIAASVFGGRPPLQFPCAESAAFFDLRGVLLVRFETIGCQTKNERFSE